MKRTILLLVWLAFAFPSLSYAAKPVTDPDLPKKFTSDNFVIFTKESPKLAKTVATSLEIFRKFFLKGFADSQCFGKELQILAPEVYIFSTQKDFQDFCSQHKKQFVNREAFFDWWWDAGFDRIKTKWHWRLISFVHKNYNDMQKYLIHELTHIFLNYYMDKIPMWLDEGIATYMQTAQIASGKFKEGYVDAGFLKEYQQAVRMKSKVAFSELFGMNSEQDAKFTSLHYAQSWAVTHYLLRWGNGKYVKRFRAFLKDCAKDGEYEKNFKKYFPIQLENLQGEVERYIFNLS